MKRGYGGNNRLATTTAPVPSCPPVNLGTLTDEASQPRPKANHRPRVDARRVRSSPPETDGYRDALHRLIRRYGGLARFCGVWGIPAATACRWQSSRTPAIAVRVLITALDRLTADGRLVAGLDGLTATGWGVREGEKPQAAQCPGCQALADARK